ncbi:MAG: histidine--tRNA ligase [Armatimonadetes bacterium]|nr:histidine--tRNA ligase [Armatimonadota bacterium]
MAEYVAPRGTRDVLPGETPKWRYLESKFAEICGLYGYSEIRTPTFEHTELFTRNLGETTDVVSKEMYTFETRGGKSLTLRPEGTAPAIRAYVQHNLGTNLPVNKLYYIGRLFRYERPQAGRYREHTQLGVEAVGSSDPAIDAEVISLAARFFTEVGVRQFDLKLNSIGCPKCRPDYRRALVEFAREKVEKLCPACATRYEQNPLRMLDCKIEACKEILRDAPRMVDYLCDECSEHFAKVRDYLTDFGIGFVLAPTLVRGFDYYTKTAFEFVSGELGAQNAIGGGGRYDNLVEEVGGPPTPGIGFGLGLDRLALTLESLGVELPVRNGTTAFVAGLGDEGHAAAVKLVWALRGEGIPCDMDYTGRSLKAQMKVADKLGARYTLIIGEDEIANGVATVRDMRSSEQKSVPLADLAKVLKSVDLD